MITPLPPSLRRRQPCRLRCRRRHAADAIDACRRRQPRLFMRLRHFDYVTIFSAPDVIFLPVAARFSCLHEFSRRRAMIRHHAAAIAATPMPILLLRADVTIMQHIVALQCSLRLRF